MQHDLKTANTAAAVADNTDYESDKRFMNASFVESVKAANQKMIADKQAGGTGLFVPSETTANKNLIESNQAQQLPSSTNHNMNSNNMNNASSSEKSAYLINRNRYRRSHAYDNIRRSSAPLTRRFSTNQGTKVLVPTITAMQLPLQRQTSSSTLTQAPRKASSTLMQLTSRFYSRLKLGGGNDGDEDDSDSESEEDKSSASVPPVQSSKVTTTNNNDDENDSSDSEDYEVWKERRDKELAEKGKQ